MPDQDQVNTVTDVVIQSPLTEAEPTSLEELFQRFDEHIVKRTLALPDADRCVVNIVSELRRQRANWERADADGSTKRAAKKSGSSGGSKSANIEKIKTTLADLGLAD